MRTTLLMRGIRSFVVFLFSFVLSYSRLFFFPQGPLSNLSYSIIAVYITILFTIGQFVRLAFGNQVARIPYEVRRAHGSRREGAKKRRTEADIFATELGEDERALMLLVSPSPSFSPCVSPRPLTLFLLRTFLMRTS
jgi:hypothetical protein